jgi:GR25 family glycosyltransferase involved in LPS biosynthesis
MNDFVNLPTNPSIKCKSLGNQLFLYFYAYLYSLNKGITLPNIYNIDFFTEKLINNEKKQLNINNLDISHIPKFPDNRCYPHDVRIYQDSVEILKQKLYKHIHLDGGDFGVSEITDTDTIVIHIRTDNIGNPHKLYTALPQSFYQNIIKKYNKISKVLLVCMKPHDKFTKHVLDSVVQIFYKNDFTIEIQHNSQLEDFKTLLSAKILVISCSTFSFWAAFLGKCTEVHIPYWGLFIDQKHPGSMYLEDWKPKDREIFLYKNPVKTKITESNFNDLYDIDVDAAMGDSDFTNDLFFKEIFVISLERCKDRRKHIEFEFSQRKFTFFNAYDKNTDMVMNMYKNDKVMKFPPCFRCLSSKGCNCANNILIPQQIGNWCSFIELLKLISQKDYGFYMICEDDVTFDHHYFQKDKIPEFEKFLKSKFEKTDHKTPHLIRLAKENVGGKPINKPFMLTENAIMSNACFVINTTFAKLFNDTVNKKEFVINHTSDVFIHRDILKLKKNIIHYSLFPAPADQLSHYKMHSEIHPKGVDENDKKRKENHTKSIKFEEYKKLEINNLDDYFKKVLKIDYFM